MVFKVLLEIKLYHIKRKENRGEDLKIINYEEDGEEKSRARED
jgi:hypothetical protein